MRILENGIYRDATQRELEEAERRMRVPQDLPVNAEERIEALEAAIMELAEVVLNG